MKLKHSLKPIGIATLIVSQASNAMPLAFTDATHTFNSTNEVRLILIDQLSELEEQLSIGLPSSPDAAQVAFNHRLSSQMSAKIDNAHQDVVDAWSIGVAKVPAVVVDAKYVVYGDLNIERALLKIRQYRKARP